MRIPAAFNFYFEHLEFRRKKRKSKLKATDIITSRLLEEKDTFSFYRIMIDCVAIDEYNGQSISSGHEISSIHEGRKIVVCFSFFPPRFFCTVSCCYLANILYCTDLNVFCYVCYVFRISLVKNKGARLFKIFGTSVGKTGFSVLLF